jgi:hypothetical protein
MKNVAVHNELNEVLQIIRGREPDNDLMRLLVDMLDAGDIEKGAGEGVWIAAADTRFSTGRFVEEDRVREAVAYLFLTREIEFRIRAGNRLDVEWHIRGGLLN